MIFRTFASVFLLFILTGLDFICVVSCTATSRIFKYTCYNSFPKSTKVEGTEGTVKLSITAYKHQTHALIEFLSFFFYPRPMKQAFKEKDVGEMKKLEIKVEGPKLTIHSDDWNGYKVRGDERF